MTTVIFISQKTPEKNVEKIINYRAYLSKDQQEEILSQIKEFNEDECQVSMHVEVELKYYKKK